MTKSTLRSRILIEESIVGQCKETPAFYESQIFVAVFKRTRHYTLFRDKFSPSPYAEL
jgi:hypothetical protein